MEAGTSAQSRGQCVGCCGEGPLGLSVRRNPDAVSTSRDAHTCHGLGRYDDRPGIPTSRSPHQNGQRNLPALASCGCCLRTRHPQPTVGIPGSGARMGPGFRAPMVGALVAPLRLLTSLVGLPYPKPACRVSEARSGSASTEVRVVTDPTPFDELWRRTSLEGVVRDANWFSWRY